MPRLLCGFLGLWGRFLGGQLKKDAFYFPHDSNAHNDPKLVSLRVTCGYEGIGLFWSLVEILRESTNYKYPYDMKMLEITLSHPIARLSPIIERCVKVGLFTHEDGFLSAPALTKKMKGIDRRRDILRQAGRRGNEIRWSDRHGNRHPIAWQSQVKESKVKKREEEATASFLGGGGAKRTSGLPTAAELKKQGLI